MTRNRRHRELVGGSSEIVALLAILALSLTGGAWGQQTVTLELSFSNPGARSMGFGGAFVALADDATAAHANPAGLVELTKAEVSVEGSSRSYTTPFTIGGRAEGRPTGIGLDTYPSILRGESTAKSADLSFLSVVYPMRRWAIALYRYQLARFESSIETQGLFAIGSGFAGTARLNDQRGFTSIDLVSHGVSAGFRVTESLSFGVGLSFVDSELRIRGESFLPDDDSLESYFGECSYLPDRSLGTLSATSDDTDFGLIAGFLWRVSPRWRVGGSSRFGLETDMDAELELGPAASPSAEALSQSGTVSLPEVYGLGIAFRTDDGRLTASLEWDRVEYSTILESIGDPNDAIPDGDEVHLGIEYAFLDSTPIVAVRLGAWLDPDHRIRATNRDPLARAVLPPGDDEIHLAVGFGLAFETFQIDLGADFSDLRNTGSVSMIYTF